MQCTYHQNHRDQLSTAFNAYLSILQNVQHNINDELNRNTPNWRALNLSSLQLWGKENLSYIKYLGSSRPLYFSYQLEDEEPLVPWAFHVVDGNYSVKCVANAGLVDTKPFVSNYIQSWEHVDQFKDEVTHKAQPGDTADVNTSL